MYLFVDSNVAYTKPLLIKDHDDLTIIHSFIKLYFLLAVFLKCIYYFAIKNVGFVR